MKNIFTLIFALFSASVFSQVAIGKTVVASPSVSLDFGTGNRGMILPWVTSTASVTGVVNGTMVYDLTDKKVKVKYDATWKDLSVNTQGTTVDPLTSIDGVAIQNAATENTLAKLAIGTLSATPGILVLEDTNKAMVLPKVDTPHLNIINPAPGMIAYDTFNKQLAVYNGTVWSFWGKENVSTVPTVTTGTGRVWMDRNLGATQVATSTTDAASYGDLYQWGRLTDAHQIRTSPVSTTLSSTDVPGNGNFIASTTTPNDWRSPQNINLWQGVSGANNPCPSGFRIPTVAEFQAESALFTTQNAAGAFNSPLKLTTAGYRVYNNGVLNEVGSVGVYWTSTTNGTSSAYTYFNTSNSVSSNTVRAYGFSIRCIKN
ncbi:MAG: hypothetical protein K0R77_2104 [Chryseobacterium sp.]|jgi:uncharacterized protein (TIGR02145 family)|uniref:FISUMP domain-containing protein n=1 Tax=Chryseobacterium sp. TaxID=1871047 RepID=UPI002612110A|nr:FISUMP domain-containing protein [Chryseobacterium sp.]MDF2552829.1 hypothetical protein [Chryseobacterium sp.]